MKFHFARIGVVPKSYKNKTDIDWTLGQIQMWFFKDLTNIILKRYYYPYKYHNAPPPR